EDIFAPDFPVFITAVKKYQSSISKTGINKWLVVKDGSKMPFALPFLYSWKSHSAPKPVQPPSPYKKALTKPYQQRAVNLFSPPSLPPVLQTSRFPPVSVHLHAIAGIEKRQASDEPEGSDPKRAKAKNSDEDEAASKDNNPNASWPTRKRRPSERWASGG
ncbi:hypothetical protein B0H10DRAFT_2080204, partial [Mycena sp. CBHHK59/15]